MSDKEQRERIISKIKKCLALSESPEPAEAAAAMRQAQKLMEKHNIDMATVERPEIIEGQVSSKMSVSRPKRWEVALVGGICRAFGLRFYFMCGSSYADDVYGKYCFVGTHEQVTIAEWTTKMLFERHGKHRREYYKNLTNQPGYYGGGRQEISKHMDSFSLGWVVAVVGKVTAMANPKKVDDAIQEQMDSHNLKDKIKARQDEVVRGAFASGNEVGDKESIYRPMDGQSGPKATLLEHNK